MFVEIGDRPTCFAIMSDLTRRESPGELLKGLLGNLTIEEDTTVDATDAPATTDQPPKRRRSKRRSKKTPPQGSESGDVDMEADAELPAEGEQEAPDESDIEFSDYDDLVGSGKLPLPGTREWWGWMRRVQIPQTRYPNSYYWYGPSSYISLLLFLL